MTSRRARRPVEAETAGTPVEAVRSEAASGPGRDGAEPLARLAQVLAAVVLAAISVLLMITTHRVEAHLLGTTLPVGLLVGAAFQLATCVFLVSATGRRLPLVVLAIAWGLMALPFAGAGPGGGILMPAVIAGKQQYSGYVVQALGVGIPLLVLAALWVARIRRIAREGREVGRSERTGTGS